MNNRAHITHLLVIALALASCSPHAFEAKADLGAFPQVKLVPFGRYVHTYEEAGPNFQYVARDANVNCLSWSPDGKLLVSMDQLNYLYVADVAHRKIIARDPRSQHDVRGKDGATFTKNGRYIVAAPEKQGYMSPGPLLLLDPRTLLQAAALPEASPLLRWRDQDHVAVARGSGRIYAVSPLGRVLAYDPPTWKVTEFPSLPDHPNVHAIAAAADGQMLAIAASGKVWIVGAAPSRAAHPIDTGWRFVAAIAVSPDGRFVAAGRDRSLRIFDVQSGELIRSYTVAPGEGIWGIDFSPDGRMIGTANGSPRLQVWDARSTALIAEIEVPDAWWSTVSFSPDGSKLAAAGADLVQIFAIERSGPGGVTASTTPPDHGRAAPAGAPSAPASRTSAPPERDGG